MTAQELLRKIFSNLSMNMEAASGSGCGFQRSRRCGAEKSKTTNPSLSLVSLATPRVMKGMKIPMKPHLAFSMPLDATNLGLRYSESASQDAFGNKVRGSRTL